MSGKRNRISRLWKEWDLTWYIFATVLIIAVGAIWAFASTFSTNTTVEGWFMANELYINDATTYRIYSSGNDMMFTDVTGGPYTLAQLATDTTYTAGTGINLAGTVFSSTAASATADGHVTTATQVFTGKKTFNLGMATVAGQKIWLGSTCYIQATADQSEVYLYVNDVKIVTWN